MAIRDTSGQDRVVSKQPQKGGSKALWVAIVGLVAVVGWFVVPSIMKISSSDRSVDKNRIRLAQVVRGNLIRDLAVEGRIVATSYPTLFSPAEGNITLEVKAGETVSKGQILAVLSSPELNNKLKQESSEIEAIESQVSRARIESKTAKLKNEQEVALKELRLAAAKRDLQRAEITFKEGLITDIDYQKAKDQVRIAELEFANAKDNTQLSQEINEFEISQKEAELNRQKLVHADLQRKVEGLTIRSPVSGMIGTVSVNPNDLVNLNQKVMTVIDLSAFEIEISIPESYSDEINPGVSTEITYENNKYTGVVSAIAPEVTNSTVKGTVVFSGETPNGMRQNQRVTTRLVLSSKENVLKVKRGPFMESTGGRKAFVVENDLAKSTAIVTGVTSMSEIEVVSGLKEGDTIIISDTSSFGDSESVLLRN